MPRTYYHFTHQRHLESILRAGQLNTTESNLSMYTPHAGPDVVWLTDRPEISTPRALGLDQGADMDPESPYSKTRIRFTLELPNAAVKLWTPWAQRKGISPTWHAALVKGRNPKRWYVIERPVQRDEWVAIHDMHTGLPITQKAPA